MGNRNVVHIAMGLLLIAAGFAPMAQSSSSLVEGELHTSQAADLAGSAEVRADHGSIHLFAPSADWRTQVHAERIEVDQTWAKGAEAKTPLGSTHEFQTEDGQVTESFDNASLGLSIFSGPPEILAIANESQDRFTLNGTGTSGIQSISDHTVTRVEWSPEGDQATGDANFPGFWYRIDGPWTSHTQLDHATLTGTFTLFVNNVTLTIDHDDGTWERWTGYREQGPDHPAQDQATQYETRVTVLQIHNGTLTLEAPDAISLFSPNATTDFQGTLTVPNARGNLATDALSYLFDDDPAELRGHGQLTLTPTPAGASSYGIVDQPTSPGLALTPTGDLTVVPSPGVEQVPVETSATEHVAAWTPWLILLALVLLAAYLARNRVGEHLAKLKAHLRHDRTTRWIQTGDRLFEMREYEDAMTWYQRVVNAYPNSIEGWNSIAACHQELGHHAEASEAYERTHRMFTEGDATSLASAMLCAHRAGDMDRAVDLAQELATIDPDLARHRLGEPRLAELRKRAGLASLFRRKEPDGASYA